MKVYIANYIYWKKILNASIAGYTWLFNINTEPSSHTEIVVFKDGKWQSFSSTNRDGASGTRWEDSYKVFKYPKRWSFYEKDCNEEEVEAIIERANEIIPAKYDWIGLLGFFDPTGKLNNINKWYCSESVWYVLTGILTRVSPRRITTWIKKLGFEKCPRESRLFPHFLFTSKIK